MFSSSPNCRLVWHLEYPHPEPDGCRLVVVDGIFPFRNTSGSRPSNHLPGEDRLKESNSSADDDDEELQSSDSKVTNDFCIFVAFLDSFLSYLIEVNEVSKITSVLGKVSVVFKPASFVFNLLFT